MPHKILALVYPRYEPLDLYGVVGTLLPRSKFYTCSYASSGDDLQVESSAGNGIITIAHQTLDQALEKADFNTLLIPGGEGSRILLQDEAFLGKVGKLIDVAERVFTVCTGSLILAATGRVDNIKATTNKLVFDTLTPKYPNVKWQRKARWVVDGRFMTSSGITAGMDAALTFIGLTYMEGEFYSMEAAHKHAQTVAWGLEYKWNDDPSDDPFSDQSKAPGKPY